MRGMGCVEHAPREGQGEEVCVRKSGIKLKGVSSVTSLKHSVQPNP